MPVMEDHVHGTGGRFVAGCEGCREAGREANRRRSDYQVKYHRDRCARDPEYAERTRSKAREAMARRRQTPEGRAAHNLAVRRTALKQRYGMTVEDYERMLAEQDGMCAIEGCGNKPGDDGRISLSVDHDHETGRVRGLLCNQCNRGLGLLGDSVDRLQAVVDYLKG